LTDFISEGHFARHIRRTRALYAERQATLLAAADHDLAGLIELHSAEAGMHLVGWLPQGMSDTDISNRAARAGVDAPALSAYALESLGRGGLLLGYAAVDQAEIRQAIQRLGMALRG
jgi:GntR family transcriptional regulator / MocR family aminotransferase